MNSWRPIFRSAPTGVQAMKFPRFSFVPALVVLVSSFAFAQTTGQPERFTANAVSLSPEYGTGQQVVEFTVNRWSPEAERERLGGGLPQQGARGIGERVL